jgi:hypothetical protein
MEQQQKGWKTPKRQRRKMDEKYKHIKNEHAIHF